MDRKTRNSHGSHSTTAVMEKNRQKVCMGMGIFLLEKGYASGHFHSHLCTPLHASFNIDSIC